MPIIESPLDLMTVEEVQAVQQEAEQQAAQREETFEQAREWGETERRQLEQPWYLGLPQEAAEYYYMGFPYFNPYYPEVRPTDPTRYFYRPNWDTEEIISLKDARLIWATTFGTGDSVAGTGGSLSVSVFDVTTRADNARIKLLNEYAGTTTLKGMVIVGKPVTRLSGEQGYIHDAFTDDADIRRHGERVFEVGNNYIATFDQLNRIMDYWAKFCGCLGSKAKHRYVLYFPGRLYWYRPGEHYRITIGSAGLDEYINSKVKLLRCQIKRMAGTVGETLLFFEEIEESWKYDSNVHARFCVKGNLAGWLRHSKVAELTVCSKHYVGVTDSRCDGTADEVQINAAVTALSQVYGKGTVRLVGDTFYLAATVSLLSGITLDLGGCTLEKNGNFAAITCTGGAGTEKTDITIRNGTITRNAADTNSQPLIDADYADRLTLEKLILDDSYQNGVSLDYCDDVSIADLKVYRQRAVGLRIQYGSGHLKGLLVDGQDDAGANGVLSKGGLYIGYAEGPYVVVGVSVLNLNHNVAASSVFGVYVITSSAASRLVMSEVTVDDLYSGISTTGTAGIYLLTDETHLSHAVVRDMDNAEGEQRERCGVYINGNNNTILGCSVYDCEGVGFYIDPGSDANRLSLCFGMANGDAIDYGDCEDSSALNAPQIRGCGTLTEYCSVARSDTQAYAGTYSRKITKTASGGTAAFYALTEDNDAAHLNGFNGELVVFNSRVYIPSGGIAASKVKLQIRYYDAAAWTTTEQAAAATYDAWQKVTVQDTIPATATGAYLQFYIESTAALNEYFYVDNVRCKIMGKTQNATFNNQLLDDGTNTRQDSNSWQP